MIGFGTVAEQAHLPAWQAIDGVEVVAVADLTPARLGRARSLVGSAALYGSPEELLVRSELDAVDICTPPGTHADLILAAFAHGVRSIVCEKPLVLSEDDYARVAREREVRDGRVLTVNNWRQSDMNRHVLSALAEDAIGTVGHVELRVGRAGCALGNEAWLPRWRTEPRWAGGGIILDHGWHQLSLLVGWMGVAPARVSAMMRTVDSRHYPVEDEAVIDVVFPKGTGRIELTWATGSRTNAGVIRGSRGTIATYDDRMVVTNAAGSWSMPYRRRLSESSSRPDWFEAMFRDDVLNGTEASADVDFALAGTLLSAVCAAYRSARSTESQRS